MIAVLCLTQPTAARAEFDGVRFGDLSSLPPGASELFYRLAYFRVRADVPATSNVAVFRYEVRGRDKFMALRSRRYSRGGEPFGKAEGHAEIRVIKLALRDRGIDPRSVKEGISDLQPCMLPGSYCEMQLNKAFPELERVYYLFAYPRALPSAPAAERAASLQIRRTAMADLGAYNQKVRELVAQGAVILTPPGASGNPGALALSPLAPFLPGGGAGGIDFSSLELRYVAATGIPGQRGMRYAFRARPGTAGSDPAAGLHLSRQSSDAFFVWLALPPSSFWVNLNPNEPNRIIDPQFARSEAGRVLLETDFLMKKTVAALVHPDTPTGDAYWRELSSLYGNRPDLPYCSSFRQWIVPAPATVHETSKELYILDAPLLVKTEGEYIGPETVAATCPREDPVPEARKQELYQRVILPHVVRAVNTAPEYAALRRVYLSRVAAEWFRQRSAKQGTAVKPIINSGKIDRWIARPAWNPLDVFNLYVKSVREGEFNVERPTQFQGRTYVRPFIYGGVDFSKMQRRKVSRRAFRARWPRLAGEIQRSLRLPTPDAQRGEVWLGGGSRAR